ncbi:MAG TPA: MFS transporter, partial [Acetobacteraceae bacterium]
MPNLTEAELERAQRDLVGDAAWASVIGVLSGGVVLVGFAVALGAGPIGIGLLGAIPALGQLAQLPAVGLVERLRRRRALAVWLGLAERAVVLSLVVLPFLADKRDALLLLFAGEVAIAALAAMSACAWNSWMHDLLARNTLGAFSARRQLWSTCTALVGGIAAGLLVDYWPEDEKLRAYAVVFAAAALCGFVSSWFLSRVPDVPMARAEAPPPLLAMIGQPFRDANFRRLILFLSSWSFSINLAAPFITVYLLQQLRFGLSTVLGLWVTSQLANALTVRLWGQLSDRFSNKAVLATLAPLFLLCLAALPFTATPERNEFTLPLLGLVHLAMGVAAGGTALAAGNIGLKLAPRGEGTAYLA